MNPFKESEKIYFCRSRATGGLFSKFLFFVLIIQLFFLKAPNAPKNYLKKLHAAHKPLTEKYLVVAHFTHHQHASVIRQKGESQDGCFKKTKHTKFSEKRRFLTHCVYQGVRNVRFLKIWRALFS